MVGLFRKVLGDPNERALKPLRELATVVNTHSDRMAAMSDDELRAQTDVFRARLADGETLDELLPEAFSVAREMGMARYADSLYSDVNPDSQEQKMHN